MRMDVLFVDDDEKRHHLMDEFNESGKKIFHVETAEQAMQALAEHQFDMLMLDHDLSIEDRMCDPDGQTVVTNGSQLADWIVKSGLVSKDVDVIVHSFNPAGASRMVKIFHSAGYERVTRIPFGPQLLQVLGPFF